MRRKRLIVYSGIALLVGLYVIDGQTKAVTLIPANVISLRPDTELEGRDAWRGAFELSDRHAYISEPIYERIDLAPGDPVCVAHHDSTISASKYYLTDKTICWTGATTPLRRPD